MSEPPLRRLGFVYCSHGSELPDHDQSSLSISLNALVNFTHWDQFSLAIRPSIITRDIDLLPAAFSGYPLDIR